MQTEIDIRDCEDDPPIVRDLMAAIRNRPDPTKPLDNATFTNLLVKYL
jgi:hypothetical protein